MQQRGISRELINILDEYGSHKHFRGAKHVSLTNAGWKRASQDLSNREAIVLERKKNAYFVEIDGVVITTGYQLPGKGARAKRH